MLKHGANRLIHNGSPHPDVATALPRLAWTGRDKFARMTNMITSMDSGIRPRRIGTGGDDNTIINNPLVLFFSGNPKFLLLPVNVRVYK
jgi:hypothetical protein